MNFLTKSPYFFEAPAEYEQSAKDKNWKPETPGQLIKLRDDILFIDNPSKEDYEEVLTKTAEELSIGKAN